LENEAVLEGNGIKSHETSLQEKAPKFQAPSGTPAGSSEPTRLGNPSHHYYFLLKLIL
jgi:hypothetical protein